MIRKSATGGQDVKLQRSEKAGFLDDEADPRAAMASPASLPQETDGSRWTAISREALTHEEPISAMLKNTPR